MQPVVQKNIDHRQDLICIIRDTRVIRHLDPAGLYYALPSNRYKDDSIPRAFGSTLSRFDPNMKVATDENAID